MKLRRDRAPVHPMDRVSAWLARILIALLYVPIVAVVILSFDDSPIISNWTHASLRWYRVLLHDDELHHALVVTLKVAVTSATLATLVGLATAAALTRYAVPARRLLMGGLFLPLLVPEIVLGVALLSLFAKVGIPLGLTTLVLGHVVIVMPYATLILLGAYGGLDPSLEEAAQDLGCNAWRRFARVILPLLRPALLASWLLCFTLSFGDIVMSTFTNGVGTTTLPLLVYSRLKQGITPEINAVGTLLIAVTMLIIVAVGVRQMRSILAGSGRSHDSSA